MPPSSSPFAVRWPRASLRTHLVAMILIATVPLAILTTVQTARDVRQQRAVLMADLHARAKSVAVALDRELDASADALRLLAPGGAPPHDGAAATVLRPAWQRLVQLDARGELQRDIGASGSRPIDDTELARLRAAWRGARAGVPVVVSLVDRSAPLRATWVAVTTADGGLRAARIGLDAWQAMLRGFAPDATRFVTLFDAERRIVARTLAPERFVGTPLPAAAAASVASAPSGVDRTTRLEGDAAYGAWQVLGTGGWGVGVGISAQAFDAAQRDEVLVAFASAALCLLTGVSAALLLAMRISRPLRRLAEGGAARADAAPIGVGEIDQLRDALVGAERERSAAAEKLATTAHEFETLFRACPTGLAFAHDTECRHVEGNAAFDALMAGTGARVERDGEPLPADQQPLAVAARRGCHTGPTELAIVAPGRPTRHVLASAAPLFDADGLPRGAIGSVVDLTARKQAEKALGALMQREQEARRDAEGANRAKDELLSMLGHELRNPLNAIVTSVEVLRKAAPASALATSARAVLARQTRHLSSMVDQLLDVGRLIADEVTLQLRPVRLREVVERSVAAMRPLAQEREQQLGAGDVADCWVRGDPNRLEQMLAQLLDNAIRFTPQGGTIGVDLVVRDAHACLSVRDTGAGIDAALISRIFEPFVQGSRGLDRSAGGLGLGLTVVKRLADLHGAAVHAQSAPGGNVFEIRLPLLRSPGPGPKQVGVVDDNPDSLAGLRTMLELAGHAVVTASDGPAGLAMLTAAAAPAVAVVDIGLPGLDGYEVARRCRAAGYRGLLIALTGYGQDRDARRSLDEGFDAHLIKPVDPDLLMRLLAEDALGD